MLITVNDENVEIREGTTVAELIGTLGFPDKGIAVAVDDGLGEGVATAFCCRPLKALASCEHPVSVVSSSAADAVRAVARTRAEADERKGMTSC